MNKVKRIARVLASICVASTCITAMNISANAEGETVASDYTLTIPATLAVTNKGWNATNGISATGTLATGKKLVVTASSDGEFALVSGENKVNYKLAESGDTNTTYANATEKTSWEFTTLSETAATQPMGIVVEDYSSKPAGDYSDTVTFTAAVENKLVASVTNVTANNGVIAGTTAPLVNVGTVTGGTMMYKVTEDPDYRPTSKNDFSSTVPTANGRQVGTYYVWYYVEGDSSHSDSEIKSTDVTVNSTTDDTGDETGD